MKTPEEIKKLMDYCYQSNPCSECSYNKKDFPECVRRVYRDAYECITHQENRIADLEERISLNTLRDAIYDDAVAHGLWEKADGPIGCSFFVSEEATELVNAGNELQLARWRFSCDETEAWEYYVEELADVIIASLSVAGKLDIDIDAAVRRKMEINKGRPWKRGKENEDEA